MRTFITVTIFAASSAACMPTEVDAPITETSCKKITEDRLVETKSQAASLGSSPYCISGKLTISGEFVDLTDFEDMREVGELEVINNPDLRSFEGLSRVRVRKGIYIRGNDSLETITEDHLSFDQTLSGSVIFDSNTKLTDISAVKRIRTITGDLQYINNAGLSSLEAFSGIDAIDNDLLINNNQTLKTIKGFGSLGGTGGNTEISNNRSLTTIDGFSINFGTVGRDLVVTGNTALSDASGLSLNVDVVNGSIRVEGNSSLSDCRADEFSDIPDAALVIADNSGSWDPCYPD